MRFKRGSKVEVMRKKEVPVSWHCAEIISGNGHTYSVKYDYYSGSASEAVVERVSRKAVRPRPPPGDSMGNCQAGDVVEVFYDNSWKIATVLKVLGGDHYLVRLLGVSLEIRVHKSNSRVRQSWQDNKWVVIGKGSRNCEDMKSNKLSSSNCYQKRSFQMPEVYTKIKLQAEDDCFAFQNDTGLQESHMVSRPLKRASPYCSSLAYTGNVQKKRAIRKEGSRQRYVPALLCEKRRSWRHASLASKGLKMMLGLRLSLGINSEANLLELSRYPQLMEVKASVLEKLPKHLDMKGCLFFPNGGIAIRHITKLFIQALY